MMWKTLYFCFLVQYIEISALNISSNSSFHKKHLETLEFSGFYTPNLKYNLEVYSASWLQKTTRYLTTLPQIQEINALESATTGPVLKYSYSNTKFALMTRDYFDYFVEHLSSTTNQIGEESHLVEYITSMLTEKLIFLKKSLKFYEPLRSLMSSTVVIIPYSCKSASQGNDMYRIKKLRLLFFQVTFWSIYRYFRHIMVFVSTSEDYSTLSSLALPLDTLIQTQIDYQTTWELPRYSLLYAAESLQKNESWKQFKYIYYTEADQILTIRNQRAISQWLAQSDDEFVFIPHRMITMIFPPLLPPTLHSYLPSWRFDATKHAQLHVEYSPTILGSCCDAGRWKFSDCDTWWYDCAKGWGLNNHTSWFRHGRTGFTMPTGTEHGGRCSYSSTHQICPIPANCNKRIPITLEDVCEEIPLLN